MVCELKDLEPQFFGERVKIDVWLKSWEWEELLENQEKAKNQENKMYLSKIDELAKETKQRGLIIGKKDEEIKQLKEIEKRYNLRLHRIVTLEKHNKELVQELNEALEKLDKMKKGELNA